MVDKVKIVITKDDEEMFEEIREFYCDEIQNCLDWKEFDGISGLANEIEDYENLFWLVQNHLPDEKLVFSETLLGFVLENEADLRKKYNSFLDKQLKR